MYVQLESELLNPGTSVNLFALNNTNSAGSLAKAVRDAVIDVTTPIAGLRRALYPFFENQSRIAEGAAFFKYFMPRISI